MKVKTLAQLLGVGMVWPLGVVILLGLLALALSVNWFILGASMWLFWMSLKYAWVIGGVMILVGFATWAWERLTGKSDKPSPLSTQLRAKGSREYQNGKIPQDRWYRFRIESVEGKELLCFILVCLDQPYIGRTEVVYCWHQPGDAVLEDLYGAWGYFPRPAGRDPKNLAGCEVYARPLDRGQKTSTLSEFRSVVDPLPIK